MTIDQPEPLPPTVSDILANPFHARARYTATRPASYRHSRITPPLVSRLFGVTYPDTPSASFYRLYEFFILDWNIEFRNELEYFCCTHPDWTIFSIPEPAGDADPVRRAVLAVLTQLMCAAFNRRAAFGLPRDAPAIILDFSELETRRKVFEEIPDWAKQVKPLDERFYIPNKDGKMLKDNDEDVSEEFKAMNIIVQMPHIHFT
jgi:hypothetical protein